MLATVRRALTIRLMCLEQAVEVQQEMMRETFQLVIKRPDNVCNFLEGGRLVGGKDVKVIYRHYATLYFVFVVDSSESELGILDLIQVSYRAAGRHGR
jgi:AP-3 complex subunit sigma